MFLVILRKHVMRHFAWAMAFWLLGPNMLCASVDEASSPATFSTKFNQANTCVLSILDRSTGAFWRVPLPCPGEYRLGRLHVITTKAFMSKPGEPHIHTVYLSVIEQGPSDKVLFRGWIFDTLPALSEWIGNVRYNITLSRCEP